MKIQFMSGLELASSLMREAAVINESIENRFYDVIFNVGEKVREVVGSISTYKRDLFKRAWTFSRLKGISFSESLRIAWGKLKEFLGFGVAVKEEVVSEGAGDNSGNSGNDGEGSSKNIADITKRKKVDLTDKQGGLIVLNCKMNLNDESFAGVCNAHKTGLVKFNYDHKVGGMNIKTMEVKSSPIKLEFHPVLGKRIWFINARNGNQFFILENAFIND